MVQGLKVVVAVRQVVVLAVGAVAAMGAVMANWMEGIQTRSTHCNCSHPVIREMCTSIRC